MFGLNYSSQAYHEIFRIIISVADIKAEHFYWALLGITGERASPGSHYFHLDRKVVACYGPEANVLPGSKKKADQP